MRKNGVAAGADGFATNSPQAYAGHAGQARISAGYSGLRFVAKISKNEPLFAITSG